MGLARKVTRGDAWYPLHVGRTYYNSVNLYCIEVPWERSALDYLLQNAAEACNVSVFLVILIFRDALEHRHNLRLNLSGTFNGITEIARHAGIRCHEDNEEGAYLSAIFIHTFKGHDFAINPGRLKLIEA